MAIERTCPLCGSSADSMLFAEARIDPQRLGEFAYASRKLPEYMHLRLLFCRGCDLVYTSPAPDVSELEGAYRDAAYDSRGEALYAARTYAAHVRGMIQRLPDRAGALDIGAGDGAFCAELQKLGFTEVVGFEPSAAPIAAADAGVRHCLRQGMFVPGLFSAQTMSLVTCFQTIEHVSEPRGLCEEAVRLLKPGGVLCLVGHNRRALSCRLLGCRSPIFDIEHLQLFSPRSLQKLLTDAGLTEVSVRPLWNTYPLSYWSRLFPFPARLKQGVLRVLQATTLGRVPISIPAGNLIAWGVRPQS